MKPIYLLIGCALAGATPAAQAQTQHQDTTLNRTVVVEQEYNPIIHDAAKVNVLPRVEPLSASKKEVEYATGLAPASSIPAPVMQAYNAKERPDKALPGYARLGYGSSGNLDLLAAYGFRFTPQDRLNLQLGMDGMNGEVDADNPWDSYYYRTRAAIDYLHAFKQTDLRIGGNFGLSNFNFRPLYPEGNGKQKFTSGDVHFGLQSHKGLPIQYQVEAGVMLYNRQADYRLQPENDELQVYVKGVAEGAINTTQRVGIRYDLRAVTDSSSLYAFNLAPYFSYQNDDWSLHLGANVDPSFGREKKFHVAPDVKVLYTFADSYQLYAQATGGRILNDFRRLEMLHPYIETNPLACSTYEQLNAAVGFKASPVSGLWIHLYGGYQNLQEDLMPYYQPDGELGARMACTQGDTHNTYAGAALSYDYKQLFGFSAEGIYRSWGISQTLGEEFLYFKPRIEASLAMDFRPIPAALITLEYRHVVREGDSTDDVSDLHLRGSYELLPGISLYVSAHNLLDKKYERYEGYAAEGINFVGGVAFRF